MPLRRSGSETQILNPRTDMDSFLVKKKMSLRRSGSETQILNPLTYNYPPSGPVYSVPPAEEVGYKSKAEDEQSIFYSYDPEIIHDYNYPPRRPDYSGDVPYKSLLAQELGYNYKTEGFKCAICDGMHDMFTCKLRDRCPFDREVPEDFEVVCLCSRIDCTKRCSYPIGRVTIKESSSYLKF